MSPNLRCLLLFILHFSLFTPLTAQTVLIDSLTSGGFELGNTAFANGWTAVNGITNKWYVGAPGKEFGNNGAYISGDFGVHNWYHVDTAVTSHLYQDITFPATGNFLLQFDIRTNGIVSGDYFKVFLVPATTTITADVLPSSGQIGAGSYYYLANWTTIRIPLGSQYNGTSQRLVLTWVNDNNSGYQPATSIDKLSVISFPPLSGMKTIDKTMPTMGDNYKSFNDAITFLNFQGIAAGGVTFNVTAGQTFTEEVIPITATGTAANTIMFQKSGSGANPVISAVGNSSTIDAGISIKGGDYITFDGINILEPTGYYLEYGYYLIPASTTDGAQYNTIKNCKISLNRMASNSNGIYQLTSAAAISAPGTNSYNKYLNLSIENCGTGISLTGITSTFLDEGCEISNCTIGGTISGDIVKRGITCVYQKSLLLFRG